MCAQRIWWHFLSFFGGPSWDRPAHLGKWNAPDTHTRGNTWTHLGGETRKRNPLKIENDHSVTIITSKPPPLQPNRWFERAHTWYWPNHQHPVCMCRERESLVPTHFSSYPTFSCLKKSSGVGHCGGHPAEVIQHITHSCLSFSLLCCVMRLGVYMIFRSTSFLSLSPLSLYGQFHRKREGEKRGKGKEILCVEI